MIEDKKKGAGGMLLNLAKDFGLLKWIRPLQHKVGGRKMLLGGGALYILQGMLVGVDVTWPLAVAALAVGLTAVGTSIAIAIEGETSDEEKEEQE